MINRGWVPTENMNPATRMEGQVEGRVKLTGLMRKQDNVTFFTPENRPEHGIWRYIDLHAMGATMNTLPIMLDAVAVPQNPGGLPVGGQSLVELRNPHTTYAVTWFALSVFLAFMTKKYVKTATLPKLNI